MLNVCALARRGVAGRVLARRRFSRRASRAALRERFRRYRPDAPRERAQPV